MALTLPANANGPVTHRRADLVDAPGRKEDATVSLRNGILPAHPPAFHIQIGFEATAPRVWADVLDDAELARLNDWLDGQPQLVELLERALEIAKAA